MWNILCFVIFFSSRKSQRNSKLYPLSDFNEFITLDRILIDFRSEFFHYFYFISCLFFFVFECCVVPLIKKKKLIQCCTYLVSCSTCNNNFFQLLIYSIFVIFFLSLQFNVIHVEYLSNLGYFSEYLLFFVPWFHLHLEIISNFAITCNWIVYYRFIIF